MQVTLLGTGCPNADTERYGPATLVDAGEGARLLFDCGSGVTQRLVAAGCPGREIDALFLTHLHSDHLVDFYQFVVSSWHQARDRRQVVYGPPGTRAFVEGTMELWRRELDLRIEHERRPSITALEVEVREIAGGDVLGFGDARIAVVDVDHKPVRHAFGFVITTPAAKVAISGDTRYCRALIEAAKGADLLVHEVFVHREMPVVEGVRTAETVANVASYHTASDVVGKVAAEAAVGMLALTHIVPPKADRQALLDEVRLDFAGPVLVGEDLMRIDAATGRVRHGNTVFGLPRSTTP